MISSRNRERFHLYIIFSIGTMATVLLSSFAHSSEIYQRDVEMAWEPVEQAYGYDVEVSRIKDDGKKIKPAVYSVEAATWKARLRIGLYQLRIRSRDDRNVPGEWSDPLPITVNFTALTPLTPINAVQLNSQNTDRDLVPFRWQAVPEAESYLLHILDSNGVTLMSQEVSQSQAELELNVGQKYQWWVQATSRRLGPGELPEKPFAFSLKGGALEAPESVDVVADKGKNLKLTWTHDDMETSSALRLDQLGDKDNFIPWEKTVSTTAGRATAKKPVPRGIYRLRLQSRHALMTASAVTTVYFRIDEDQKVFLGKTLEDVKSQPLRQQGWSTAFFALARSSSVEATYPDLQTQLKSEDNNGYGAEWVVRRTSSSRTWSQSLELHHSQMAGSSGTGSYKLIHETLRLMNEWSFLRNRDQSSEFRLRTGLGALISTELYPNAFNTGVETRDYSLMELILGVQWASRWSDRWLYTILLQLESNIIDTDVPTGFESFGGGHLQVATEYLWRRKTHFILRLNARGHTLVYMSQGERRENNLGSVHLDLGVRWNF